MRLPSANSLAVRTLLRIVQIAGTLLAVSIIVFIIQAQIPGDAAVGGKRVHALFFITKEQKR